jgi:hypothetical protein
MWQVLANCIDQVHRRVRALGVAARNVALMGWQSLKPTPQSRSRVPGQDRATAIATWQTLADRIDQAHHRARVLSVAARTAAITSWQALQSRCNHAPQAIRAIAIATWQRPMHWSLIASAAVIAIAVAGWSLMPREQVMLPEVASPRASPPVAAALPASAPPQEAQPQIASAPAESPPASEPVVPAKPSPAPQAVGPDDTKAPLAPMLKPMPPAPRLIARLKPTLNTAPSNQ